MLVSCSNVSLVKNNLCYSSLQLTSVTVCRRLMIQTSQSIGDAPYGDHFTVEVSNPNAVYNVDFYLAWNFLFVYNGK